MGVQIDHPKKLDLGVDNYQLHRVMPSQLAAFWPKTKLAIARSLPPTETVDETVMASIMKKIMQEDMVLWVLIRKEEGQEPRLSLVVLLAFVIQLGKEDYKNLLLYALAGMDESIPEETWGKVMQALVDYGKMTGCKNLVGVTKDPKILKLFRLFYPEQESEMRVLTKNLED